MRAAATSEARPENRRVAARCCSLPGSVRRGNRSCTIQRGSGHAQRALAMNASTVHAGLRDLDAQPPFRAAAEVN
jgi:hypothetical protein